MNWGGGLIILLIILFINSLIHSFVCCLLSFNALTKDIYGEAEFIYLLFIYLLYL